MAVINLFACFWLYSIRGTPSFDQFMWINILWNLSCAYIDCLAEGISAVITKLSNKLKAIEELEGKTEDEGDDSMRAYGIYNGIRWFFQSIMTFIGGILVQYTSLKTSAIILSVYSFVLITYVLFVFREKRVKNCVFFRFLIFLEKSFLCRMRRLQEGYLLHIQGYHKEECAPPLPLHDDPVLPAVHGAHLLLRTPWGRRLVLQRLQRHAACLDVAVLPNFDVHCVIG